MSDHPPSNSSASLSNSSMGSTGSAVYPAFLPVFPIVYPIVFPYYQQAHQWYPPQSNMIVSSSQTAQNMSNPSSFGASLLAPFSNYPPLTQGAQLAPQSKKRNSQPKPSKRNSQPEPSKHSSATKPTKPKTRRERIVFSPEMLTVLRGKFLEEQYPCTKEKADIAAQLGIPCDNVNFWYKNRRAEVSRLQKKEAAVVSNNGQPD